MSSSCGKDPLAKAVYLICKAELINNESNKEECSEILRACIDNKFFIANLLRMSFIWVNIKELKKLYEKVNRDKNYKVYNCWERKIRICSFFSLICHLLLVPLEINQFSIVILSLLWIFRQISPVILSFRANIVISLHMINQPLVHLSLVALNCLDSRPISPLQLQKLHAIVFVCIWTLTNRKQ